MLLVLSGAADLLLTVELPQRRFVSLGTTFGFISFLSFGALGAAFVSVIAWCAAQVIRRLVAKEAQQPPLVFIAFNAGQLSLCAVGAGITAWLATGTPFNAPPTAWTLPLLVYVTACLVLTIGFTTVATALRYDMREVREQLWPGVSTWTALSFAICGPLALMAAALATQIGLLSATLLTFAALIALSYILRLTISYDRANAELQVLNEISASLTATLEFGTLFPSIYRGAGKLMDVDAFYIALGDEERREVKLVYLVEDGAEVAPRTLPYGVGLVSRVLSSGKPLAVDQMDP